jgi:hypothetical protein
VNEKRTGKCLRQVEHIRGHFLLTWIYIVHSIQNVFSWEFACWSKRALTWKQTYQTWYATSGVPEFTPGSCYSIFSFICMFCRSLFVLLYFFFWPLCCLFFFDIRILIAPLVSLNSSYYYIKICEKLTLYTLQCRSWISIETKILRKSQKT